MRRVEHQSLLFIYAHPDDESFLSAGTITHYRRLANTRIALVTATRGGAATRPPDADWMREDLEALRAKEMDAASQILGIHHTALLTHPDRGLATSDHELIRRELVSAIRLHRPQVVVTFDPNGQNLHADHIAISRYTSDAVAAASDARWLPETGPAHVVQRLLWTTPVTVWDALRAPLRVPLAERPGVDFLIDTSAYVAEKEAALRAHVTQRPGIDRLLLATGDREAALSVESYRLGWVPAPRARPAACLFEGLDVAVPLPNTSFGMKDERLTDASDLTD